MAVDEGELPFRAPAGLAEFHARLWGVLVRVAVHTVANLETGKGNVTLETFQKCGLGQYVHFGEQ